MIHDIFPEVRAIREGGGAIFSKTPCPRRGYQRSTGAAYRLGRRTSPEIESGGGPLDDQIDAAL